MATCEFCGKTTGNPEMHFGIKYCSECYAALRGGNAEYFMRIGFDNVSLKVRSDIVETLPHLEELEREKQRIEEEKQLIEQQKWIEKQQREEEERKKIEDYENNKKNFLYTTSNYFEGYRILQYFNIIKSAAALPTSVFTSVSSAESIGELLGKEKTAITSFLIQMQDVMLYRLKEDALLMGANAIIGVNYNIIHVGTDLFMAYGYGTAVKVEKNT